MYISMTSMTLINLAAVTLERIKRGEEQVLSAEEFWRGMDD